MLKLRNPYIFAPIKTGYCDGDGLVTVKHLAYYRKRARHAGAVIPEPFYLHSGLREIPDQMGIDGDDKISGLKQLVGVVHEGGAKAIAHLNHPGRMANPQIPGNVFISSTDQACESGGAQPRRMDKEDMDAVRDLFITAARNAVSAGFDILELQLGHGYLLAQFLSPLVNDRHDEYGGNFTSRSRFPLEVVDAVAGAVDLPIIVRISGAEMVSGGIELEESIALARELKKRNVAAVHVSAGTVCSTPPWYFQHMFVPRGKTWAMAEKIHKEANLPVVAVGRIDDENTAQKIEKNMPGCYLAVGRALVADPDFVGKVLNKAAGPIRPCLACAEGCLGGVKSGAGLKCLVNPEVGYEHLSIEPAHRKLGVAVVGGGLAGMQAAVTLFDRGHKVDLFENEQLGGQFNLAPLTPHKQSMKRLVPYFREELRRRKIAPIARKANARDITGYNVVIVATGSRPKVPPIPGLKDFRGANILADKDLPRDQHVLIIGGGLIGIDVATALIPLGNRITIVKRTTDFGENMEMIAKKLSLKIMRENGTRFSNRTHIQRVAGRTVHALREKEQVVFEDVDLIVVATGMKSRNELMAQIDGAVPFHMIGDAHHVGNAEDAIADAYRVCSKI